MSTALPRLLDRRQIADELGITLAAAERIMRHVGPTAIGRRYYLTDQQVLDYLNANRQPTSSRKAFVSISETGMT